MKGSDRLFSSSNNLLLSLLLVYSLITALYPTALRQSVKAATNAENNNEEHGINPQAAPTSSKSSQSSLDCISKYIRDNSGIL